MAGTGIAARRTGRAVAVKDTAAIRIRRATVEECGQLSALCLRSKAMWGYDEAFLETCRDELVVTAAAIEADVVRVAANGEEILGVAEISFEDEEAEVEKLFVEPSATRLGVGAKLMDWLVDAARQGGARRLIIAADPSAADFYRRVGAVDAGTIASVSIPGRELPRLIIDLS